MRLSDLGEVALCSTSGDAIGVRAAVLIVEREDGVAWGGQVWPYRPLALTPGRYTIRVRGEDLGWIIVHEVHIAGEREVGDFSGLGRPSPRLLELVRRGGDAHPGRGPRYPRVARDTESDPFTVIAGSLVGGFQRIFTRSRGRQRLRQ